MRALRDPSLYIIPFFPVIIIFFSCHDISPGHPFRGGFVVVFLNGRMHCTPISSITSWSFKWDQIDVDVPSILTGHSNLQIAKTDKSR